MNDSNNKSDFDMIVEKIQNEIYEQDLVTSLESLPGENLHCAHLAIITLEKTLDMLK